MGLWLPEPKKLSQYTDAEYSQCPNSIAPRIPVAIAGSQ